MGEENKKISFGFSKLIKKTQIVSSKINQPKIEKSNIELIECFEEKAMKLKNHVEPEDKTLIIPLQRHQDKSMMSSNQGNYNNIPSSLVNSATPTTINSEICSSDADIGVIKCIPDTISSESNLKTDTLTLDEIAAKEILQDLKSMKDVDECRIFTVPLTTNPPSGETESTLEDYESIPVGDFGLAMLRGMGWCPGKGIGKNEKLVTPSLPTLRPKGMGLGADKVLQTLDKPKTNSGNEELKMVKNSYVRVLAGQHKSSYGQVEGFDDETGRLIVKLSLKNESVSLNEFMVQLVDKQEFLKNSKVINVSKYEQYKDENKEKSITPIENNSKRTLVSKKSVENLPKLIKGSQHKVIAKSLEKKDHIRIMNADMGDYDKFSTESIKHQTKRNSRSRSSSSDSAYKRQQFISENKLETKKGSSKEQKSRKTTKHSSSRRSSTSSCSISSDSSYRQNKKFSKSNYRHHDGDTRSSYKKKHISDKQRRSSTSSSSSSASSDYKKKRDSKTHKKKSSSKKSKDRNRSRTPRKHISPKKHRSKHRDRS